MKKTIWYYTIKYINSIEINQTFYYIDLRYYLEKHCPEKYKYYTGFPYSYQLEKLKIIKGNPDAWKPQYTKLKHFSENISSYKATKMAQRIVKNQKSVLDLLY